MVLQENRDKIDEAKDELGGITKKIDALTGDVRDLKTTHRENTGRVRVHTVSKWYIMN